MNVAMDLPEDLVREIKIRAVHEGAKLKEMYAALLRKGLNVPNEEPLLSKPVLGKDPVTGLPVILGSRPASPGNEMTPERIKEILLEDEVERYRKSS